MKRMILMLFGISLLLLNSCAGTHKFGPFEISDVDEDELEKSEVVYANEDSTIVIYNTPEEDRIKPPKHARVFFNTGLGVSDERNAISGTLEFNVTAARPDTTDYLLGFGYAGFLTSNEIKRYSESDKTNIEYHEHAFFIKGGIEPLHNYPFFIFGTAGLSILEKDKTEYVNDEEEDERETVAVYGLVGGGITINPFNSRLVLGVEYDNIRGGVVSIGYSIPLND